MSAVGIYLQELREAQRLTLKAVAEGLGVSDRIVSAWEKGEHTPKIDVIPGLLARLHGAWEDVAILMGEEANEETARGLARRRLTGKRLTDEQRAFIEGLDPDQLTALLAVAKQMRRP